MKNWEGIVIHCSDSSFGDALVIDQWHKENGWTGCGYHFVITNGRQSSKSNYLQSTDGQIQSARSLSKSGAHAKRYNGTYIGICLIGKKDFTDQQIFKLGSLIKELCQRYNIDPENVIGHYQCTTANGKTCPNFAVQNFIKSLFK